MPTRSFCVTRTGAGVGVAANRIANAIRAPAIGLTRIQLHLAIYSRLHRGKYGLKACMMANSLALGGQKTLNSSF
jgi:hypothetical protein